MIKCNVQTTHWEKKMCKEEYIKNQQRFNLFVVKKKKKGFQKEMWKVTTMAMDVCLKRCPGV